MVIRLILGWLLAAVAFGASAQAEERRVALVVGNGAYQAAPALRNPAGDARAIAAALRRLDFQVIEGIDLTRHAMEDRLRAFGRASETADVALFFFAGHGMQVREQNFVLPVDAKPAREQDLAYEAIALDTVLAEAGPARRLRILILDACRDNPIAQRIAATTRGFGTTRGFRVVEQVSSDTLIGYATAANTVAEDGQAPHSPYTTALLQNLEVPGVEVNTFFGKVRDDVLKATGNRQRPFTYGSVGGEPFYFKPPAKEPAVQPAPAVAAPAPAAAPVDAAELAFWDAIRNSSEAGDYRAYLEAYPTGRFAPLARSRAERYATVATHPPEAAPPKAPPEAAAPKALPEAAPKALPEPASKPSPEPASKASPKPAPAAPRVAARAAPPPAPASARPPAAAPPPALRSERAPSVAAVGPPPSEPPKPPASQAEPAPSSVAAIVPPPAPPPEPPTHRFDGTWTGYNSCAWQITLRIRQSRVDGHILGSIGQGQNGGNSLNLYFDGTVAGDGTLAIKTPGYQAISGTLPSFAYHDLYCPGTTILRKAA